MLDNVKQLLPGTSSPLSSQWLTADNICGFLLLYWYWWLSSALIGCHTTWPVCVCVLLFAENVAHKTLVQFQLCSTGSLNKSKQCRTMWNDGSNSFFTGDMNTDVAALNIVPAAWQRELTVLTLNCGPVEWNHIWLLNFPSAFWFQVLLKYCSSIEVRQFFPIGSVSTCSFISILIQSLRAIHVIK